MTPPEKKPALSRRTLFAGAGTAGALAVAATALPLAPAPQPVAAAPEPADGERQGYQLTEHVRRYYRSTRL